MIKLIALRLTGDQPDLYLTFSDGISARWSAAYLIKRDTILTCPLADLTCFRRAFIESGALARPNGLELSPAALHEKLEAANLLKAVAA